MIKFEVVVFIVLGIIAIIGFIFKIDRYKTKTNSKKGWQKTGERFVDKGKNIEVYYNPKTGERSYQEVNLVKDTKS